MATGENEFDTPALVYSLEMAYKVVDILTDLSNQFSFVLKYFLRAHFDSPLRLKAL